MLFRSAQLKAGKEKLKACPYKTILQLSRERMQVYVERKSEGVLGKLSVGQLHDVAGKLGVG